MPTFELGDGGGEKNDLMTMAEVVEEEAYAKEEDTTEQDVAAPFDGLDELFSMPEAEEQVFLALLYEHRTIVVQLEVERADAVAAATLVDADLELIDVNWAVYAFVQSAFMLRRERRKVHIIDARRDLLFVELEASDDEEPEQPDDDAKEGHVGGSGWFTPAANNDEAGGSSVGVINLTSNGEKSMIL